ncbi:hypothetical protein ACFS32_01045 [Novosphingobium pokkalii]|uniref:hypothetical protein n=1 Tax=Novosphingobium pokkalii TaxID=1770194 RepID=UPI0036374E66
MTDRFRVARQVFSGLLALVTLLGAPAAQAKDPLHALSGAHDLQVVVPEGPANGAIALPATGPATTTLPPARGMIGLAPAPASSGTAMASLADLVEATPVPAHLSPELECLAGAVYFDPRAKAWLANSPWRA